MNDFFREFAKDFLLHSFFKNKYLDIMLKSLIICLFFFLYDFFINNNIEYYIVYIKIYLIIFLFWSLPYFMYNFFK